MLFKLLTLPVMGPIRGSRFILEAVAEMADRELLDEDQLRKELLTLQWQAFEGSIDDDEFAAQEAEILRRMRIAREHRQATSGSGVVSWDSDSGSPGVEVTFDNEEPG